MRNIKLTEKERLLSIFDKVPVDRPAVICPGGMMSAATTEVLMNMGGGFHTDPAVMAKAAEEIKLATGFENLGVPFCMTVEAESLGSAVDLGDAFVEPRVTAYVSGEPAEIIGRPLPDPQNCGRIPVMLEAIRLLAGRNRDVPVVGNLTGPVSLATSIMDPLVFFRLMRRKPEDIRLLLDCLTEYLVRIASLQIAAGAGVIVISDPTATGEILGESNFREFVGPCLARITGEIRTSGSRAVVHICGDASALLEALKDIRECAFSFDSVVNMGKVREKLGGSVVMGNVSTQLLHQGTPERIARVVKHNIACGVDIISPACGISLMTPRLNLRALTAAVKGEQQL